MPASNRLSSHRSKIGRVSLLFYLGAGAIILAAFVYTMTLLGPNPPRVVSMTKGTPGSDYDRLGQQYKAILARDGVELRLVPSQGAVENLRLLNDARMGVSAGFVQAGLTDEKKSPNLLSLGTLCHEPLWLFFRDVSLGQRLEGLRGRRLSIGPEGSGGRELALALLALNGIDKNLAELLPLTQAQATESLLRGEIDAAILVSGGDSSLTRRLLASPRIRVHSFLRADAYVALFPFLNKLVLPTGVGNMAASLPPQDVMLIAPKASLIVRRDVHPAIQYLLLNAALEIHSGPGIFHKAGQFPAAERVDLPLSADALQFYKSGAPFLQRYLPFWLAVLFGRLLIILIPVLGVAYPLLRIVPSVYAWAMRNRIYRLYGELKFIEQELESSSAQGATEILARLDSLEQRAHRLRVPVAFSHILYTVRVHIRLVRARLAQDKAKEAPLSPPS